MPQMPHLRSALVPDSRPVPHSPAPAPPQVLQPRPAASSTLRVLIATDNHLGYQEQHATRGEDTFRTFEEVLLLARTNHADMLLLAGDLFHDNKPSRSTMYKTMMLLRKHCMHGRPNDALRIEANASSQRPVPNVPRVALPVFVIHGNHDDPTGGAANDALSALDVLEAAGLISYFGRVRSNKKIVVEPVVLRKGKSRLALYGLGNIRDEVLHDTWATQKCVTFPRPRQSCSLDDRDEICPDDSVPCFSLFALHQNRYTRGSSRGISETLLPEWLDYVVWGHEHQSKPHLTEKKPYIVQPGSTVATSLSQSEVGQKNAVLIDVRCGELLSHRVVPLHTVRGFEFKDVLLKELDGVSEQDGEQRIQQALQAVVDDMVARQNSLFEQKLAAYRDNVRNRVISGIEYPPHSFYVEKLEGVRKPLVRLRVEISGNWNRPSPQGFGRMYEDKIASPWDTILYYQSQRLPLKRSRTFLAGSSSTAAPKQGVAGESDEEVDSTRNQTGEKKTLDINKLICECLCSQRENGGMEILEIDELCYALGEHVNKEGNTAILDYLETFLNKTQKNSLEEAIAARRRVDLQELREKYSRNARDAVERVMKNGGMQEAYEERLRQNIAQQDPFEQNVESGVLVAAPLESIGTGRGTAAFRGANARGQRGSRRGRGGRGRLSGRGDGSRVVMRAAKRGRM